MDKSRHLLIAGTGRAGTSALVQYLNALGLETHLGRADAEATWHAAAQAGFEDTPLSAEARRLGRPLPYVIKSPWAYQLIDEILADPALALDAVIVPMRDLNEAAVSRSVNEYQAMHQAAPWMTHVVKPWDHWGVTPGGTVFSVNPIDQARLLATGFHRLLERLAPTEIPVVLLGFPKFATDADYLFRKLQPILPAGISLDQVRMAQAATFMSDKVRVGAELANNGGAAAATGDVAAPDLIAIENAALKREVERLREEIAAQLRALEAEVARRPPPPPPPLLQRRWRRR